MNQSYHIQSGALHVQVGMQRPCHHALQKPAVVRPHTSASKRPQSLPRVAKSKLRLIIANSGRIVATVALEMGHKAMIAVVLFWLQSLLLAIVRFGYKEYSFAKEYKVSF
jgi:hypothetical protein